MSKRWADFRTIYSLPGVTLAAFTLLGLLVLGFGIFLFGAPKPKRALPVPVVQTAKPILIPATADLDKLTIEYERVKNLMESAEHRLDNLQKLLAVLVTTGTLFGIAAGFSAYSNLKDIQRDVSRVLESAKSDLAEMRSDFPAVARVSRTIEDILAEIPGMFHDWDSDSYALMKEPERQQVFLAEMTFLGLQPFVHHRASEARHKVGRIHRGFGLFYAGRYAETRAKDSPDFCRAALYFERADEHADHEESAAANKDFGVLLVNQSKIEGDDSILVKAEAQFKRALSKKSVDPGSLTGLAWIQKRTSRLPEAISNVTKIIENKQLSGAEERRYLWKAYFNRACYLACEAATQTGAEKEQRFRCALDDLKESTNVARRFGQLPDRNAELARETKNGKDLHELRSVFPNETN